MAMTDQLVYFAELKLLIDEYDPSNSDWNFRRGALLDVLVRLWPKAESGAAQQPSREPIAWLRKDMHSFTRHREVAEKWIKNGLPIEAVYALAPGNGAVEAISDDALCAEVERRGFVLQPAPLPDRVAKEEQ